MYVVVKLICIFCLCYLGLKVFTHYFTFFTCFTSNIQSSLILHQLATNIGICLKNKISDLILELSYAIKTSATFSQPCLLLATPDFPPGPLNSPNNTFFLSNTADISHVSSSVDHFVLVFFLSLRSTLSFKQSFSMSFSAILR